jgi:hypothetical protein
VFGEQAPCYVFIDRFCDWTDVLLLLAGIDFSKLLLWFFSSIDRLPLGRAVGQGTDDSMKRLDGRYWSGPAVVVD